MFRLEEQVLSPCVVPTRGMHNSYETTNHNLPGMSAYLGHDAEFDSPIFLKHPKFVF